MEEVGDMVMDTGEVIIHTHTCMMHMLCHIHPQRTLIVPILIVMLVTFQMSTMHNTNLISVLQWLTWEEQKLEKMLLAECAETH